MIDLHIYKSPKDGSVCALVTAASSNNHNATFYHSGYGVNPNDAFEYAKQLRGLLDQEIVVSGDESLIASCGFKT